MAKRLMIASLAALAAASAASAQTDAPKAATRAELVKEIDEGFARVDTNKDGVLTSDEVQALQAKVIDQASDKLNERLAQDFAKLDKDKSGQLSLEEFKAGAAVKPRSANTAIERMDSNKDGKISKTEFAYRPLAAFDRLDANKDGKVTPDEQAKAAGR